MSFFLAIIMISCIFTSFSVAAQENEWRTIRVSTGINKSLYLNEDGEAEGYCSEYLNQLAKINHWKLEYVVASWNESVQKLYDGDIDLLLPTQMTEERKDKMGFSESIGGYQPIGLFAKADSDFCYDDFERFNGAKIALSTGTSNEMALQKYAEENNFTYEPVYMNTTDEKMKALSDGTVDMIVFSTLNDVDNGKVVAMLDYLPFYYCTNIENTELLDELNYGMKQMIIRNPTLVQNVFYDFMNRNISFAYTTQEKAEIEKKGKIVVGVYEDTPPLFKVENDGSYSGIYVDLIKRIEEISKLTIEIRPLDRKQNSLECLDEGKIDFVMGSSDQALKYEDNQNFVQSEGVMDYYTIAITQKDCQPEKSDKLVYALTSGRRYWFPSIIKECPEATVKYYTTSKECLEAVQSGEADITLLNTWEYNYQSKNTRFQNLIEWESSRTLSETVFISLQNENELIRSVMDKAIEQIPNAEKEGIITANLNNAYADYSFSDRLYSIRTVLIVAGVVIIFLTAAFFIYIFMRRKSMHLLEETNNRLAQANEAKDRFLSRMSHELRTPLNAISGYTTVVEQGMDMPDFDKEMTKSNLQSIHQAVKYQLAIIGDLLDIQKIESGKVELNNVEVDASSYMDDLVKMIKPEADEKNISFTYQRLSKVNDTYILDGVRFQQVLLNILHNAIKFTQEGGSVTMTAEVIDAGEKTNTLKFVISDTGIGMSEEFQKHYLFKRFAQEYSGNTSPYEGCGTGLALCYDIIHLMGGTITCESTKGIGSTFTVILTAEHTPKRKRRRQTSYPVFDFTGVHILLCEDNPMNQDMERRILEKMKCQVDIAEDGVAGLDKFTESECGYYDMILMDIRMPNMDGWECTKKIRELERSDAKEVPILAVSANVFDDDVKHSLEVGMNEHLSKPVDVRILGNKISQYCKKKQ